MKRTNLLVGLAVLVLVAAAPAFVVLVNFQRELQGERESQASAMALQQAKQISASVGNLVEGTRQMMLAASASGRVRTLDPACTEVLREVRQSTRAYTVLAAVGLDGTLACSDPGLAPTADALGALVRPFRSVTRFSTGVYTTLPAIGPPMLTFALPLSRPDGTRVGILVAGLDVTRLAGILAGLDTPSGGRYVIAGRDGVILASAPESAGAPGMSINAEQRATLDAPAAGTLLAGPKGHAGSVTGYVPAGLDSAGLFVSAGFDVADLVNGVDRAARRAYWRIALGAAISVLLALLIGYRYLRIPAAVLLGAARRWGRGDLSARAIMPLGAASEFTGLGRAFNEMAELLQHQRAELQALNEALEIRVAERTRALLDSNNRLQVEIAERELTEASLRQAQKLQAVGQLAGGMANEFNNVLTVVSGSIELLRKLLPSADDGQSRLMDASADAVARGAQLTAQLLAFSRKQPLFAVSVDVADAIRSMAGLLASTLGASVRLESRLESELWPAMLDPNQFEAALLNLALNARDAMPSGGRLAISAANTVVNSASSWAELAEGDYVCITVADSGIGMAEEIVNRAFEPFFTTKPPGNGSGLGLSQVHGMVRQSGGAVVIESRPGDGTRVIMMLPRGLTGPARDLDGIDYTLPALGRTEAVLLVDDDAEVRAVTEAVLLDSGYTVLTASNGMAALETLEREGGRIGLIIADYAMPGMTGRELLQIVRHRWASVAVLLATGYADYPELTGQDLPIDQIIRKPFRSNELLARIHMVVQRQGRSEMLESPVGAG